MADSNPQTEVDLREAARHLLQRPLTCAEHDQDVFRLIRRHEGQLDQWFTQRLGYRLHLDSDTARLYKVGYVPDARPLRAKSGRPLNQLEYMLLSLVLAVTAAGPAVVSLRDLVGDMRSAAAEADIELTNDLTERRAIVTILRWMIEHGLASELHEHIDSYAADAVADAVLRMRPDRIALMPVPALVGAQSAEAVIERAEQRQSTRPWLRRRLVEDPVVYRTDLTDDEWIELRRRLGEERPILDEMFGLAIEVRAEGVAAIDPRGLLSGQRFPIGGTLGHAALLVIESLGRRQVAPEELVEIVITLIDTHARHWSNEYTAAPDRLARDVVDTLVGLRLAERRMDSDGADFICLLPAAARFLAIETAVAAAEVAPEPETLW
ncbi:MAG: TIGR02678 family protein [Ilumatobacteraceae bacterium]